MFLSRCESCRQRREIVSGRGSRFLLCRRSQSDRRFPKYPPQPILQCLGYEPEETPSEETGSDAAGPEPEAAEPEAAEPEAAELEAAEPEVAELEIAEPDSGEPNATGAAHQDRP